MKNPVILLIILVILLILYAGCEKYSDKEIYQRPDWLPGKLYTTVKEQENLTMFSECLRLTGLDTILDVSGCFTVFAPTDEAMEQFLTEHQYTSLSAIPPEELERIVEFHIIQNPWSLEQLQSLSPEGWRADKDRGRSSFAYKRETIWKSPVKKYWIHREKGDEMIVMDSTKADNYKKVFVDSRKYVPIFYDLFMDANELTSDDFSFYFNRAYEPGNVYYAGSRIARSDIFAENGFVHIIDRVVEPMLNAEESLERTIPGESYRYFLDMVYWYYPTFELNMEATEDQREAQFGGIADTLWDLNFSPGLAFSIQEERTAYFSSSVNLTLVTHNGLFAPTDDAFEPFIDDILTEQSGYPHWPDYKSLPADITKILIARNFYSSPLYPSSHLFSQIFSEEGGYSQNEIDIIRKEFGSNCTFMGINSYTPDPVFTSVTGPVFLRPNYSLFRRALQYADIADEIAAYDGDLCFFAIPDFALFPDSSLILNGINFEDNGYYFTEFNRSSHRLVYLDSWTLRNRIMNHVAISLPDGSADKEFLRTMGGHYIIWNHTENTVQGDRPSTKGYNGTVVTTCIPTQLNEPSDNGETWSVRYWFNAGEQNMCEVLSGFSRFYDLLAKAGLIDPYSRTSSFLVEDENYTVFAPSDEALARIQADTMSLEVLVEFLKYHFIEGTMIFTDNKQPSGLYATAAGIYLDIKTGRDIIEIFDIEGNPYVSIPENKENTNIMVTENSRVSSVVHTINEVLIPY